MAFTFSIQAFKGGFFDRKAIESKIAPAKKKLLGKFGAFSRQRARSSIRLRKASSPPGQPPSSHEGSYRRLILFALDPATESVVMGPVAFGPGAAATIELGGDVTRTRKDGSARRLHYRGNPAIVPAGRAEAQSPTFRELLRDMVR